MRKKLHAAMACVIACTVAVAGCAADDTLPSPTSTGTAPSSSSATAATSSTPTPTKTLTPEEQDLQDAGDAVTQYWRVIDKVASDPTVSLNILATVARSQALEQWQTTLAEFRTKQWKQAGASAVSDLVPSTTDGDSFTVTACVDVTDVDVVDNAGKSVVVESRPERQQFTYQVTKAPEGFFVTQDTLKGQPCAA